MYGGRSVCYDAFWETESEKDFGAYVSMTVIQKPLPLYNWGKLK